MGAVISVTAKEIEAQRGYKLGQGHTAVRTRTKILTQVSVTPEVKCSSHYTINASGDERFCGEHWAFLAGPIKKAEARAQLNDWIIG